MTDFKNSKVLKLTLDFSQPGEIIAEWNNDPSGSAESEDEPWTYNLDIRQLMAAAADVDLALKSLIALDWGARLPETPRPDYKAPLQALAEAGMRLRLALMTGKLGDKTSGRAAADFLRWFDESVAGSAPGDWRIEIVNLQHPTQTFPFGLCFDLAPDKDLADLDVTDPNQFNGFWCQGYGLATRGRDPTARKMKLKREGIVTMLTVQERPDGGKSQIEETAPRPDLGFKEEKNKEKGYLIEDPDEYARLVREAVDQQDRDLYIYLSLRSDMKPDDPNALSIPEVRELRSNADSDVVMLAVLDGDAVIRGDRGTAWLEEITAMGQNGLIATEVDIRNKQLLFLGWEVLSDILTSGKTIIDAINDYRRKEWPLGLIYGVYCNPIHIYVDPPPIPQIESIGQLLRERRNAAL